MTSPIISRKSFKAYSVYTKPSDIVLDITEDGGMMIFGL